MIHPIHIIPAVNGFIVHVECKTFVFTSIKDLANELAFYLKRPDEVERFYRENGVNKYLMGELRNPAPTCDTVRASESRAGSAARPVPWPDCPVRHS